jgi:hypothetical protein
MCWDLAPWVDSNNANLAYGFASYNNVPCGTCYQLQFTGACHGASTSCSPLLGKTMIVQIVSVGSVGANQFDLLIPGGGVGVLAACSNQWGTSDLGADYGGFLSGCAGDATCTRNKCTAVFAGKPLLLNGCNWLVDWLSAADNPAVKYTQLSSCPAAITAKSGMLD